MERYPILGALAAALFIWLQGTIAVVAQETRDPAAAVLIADEVFIDAERILVARGNVEVFHEGRRLTAREVRYASAEDRLTITGPLELKDAREEEFRILASSAEIDGTLRAGILRGARLLMGEYAQIAAVSINRQQDRYQQLYKAVATSCRVCETGRPPLWQIRAERVVHDLEERQLYFENAQFRIRNVPVFYVPRLRMPAPGVERATGFLFPSLRQTSQLGLGIKIPYFITLGNHRDLTLTPYLSPETRTLEFRYRQAFRNGDLAIEGAVSDDSLETSQRGYLIAKGNFELPRDFQLNFDLELTSDDAYLLDYGYPHKDRLDSAVSISRARRNSVIEAAITNYNSLRANENDGEQPTLVVDGSYERRVALRDGSELTWGLETHAHWRRARDVARINVHLNWHKSWTIGPGLRVEADAGLAADAFRTQEDPVFQGTESQLVPTASLAFRYPLRRQTPSGATQLVEPVAFVGWTGGSQLNIANEESTRVEFDEGNLLALSRFPAPDRREHGAQLALGINLAHHDPSGWRGTLSLGQVFREDALTDFAQSSGLQGTTSDILVAGSLASPDGLALGLRALLNDEGSVNKAELRADWEAALFRISGSYLWLDSDPQEDRTRAVSEVALDGSYRVQRHWTVNGEWRYDSQDDRTARAGLGLSYENECVAARFSVARRFTSSSSVEPSTDFGFTIELRGFNARTDNGTYTRSCS